MLPPWGLFTQKTQEGGALRGKILLQRCHESGDTARILFLAATPAAPMAEAHSLPRSSISSKCFSRRLFLISRPTFPILNFVRGMIFSFHDLCKANNHILSILIRLHASIYKAINTRLHIYNKTTRDRGQGWAIRSTDETAKSE